MSRHLARRSPLKTTAKAETQSSASSQLDITRIPATMDGLGWKQGARFMRKWFNNPSYELPLAYKKGEKDARDLTNEKLLNDLPFEWLTTASTRVTPVIKELEEEFSDVREYNSRVGRLKAFLDQLSNGLIVLMSRLEKLKLLDMNRNTFIDATRYFGGLPASELEYTSQFNFVKVGTSTREKAFDSLDDVYGALGAFSIKLAATWLRTYSSHLGSPAIEIEELGLYVRDTYDFVNEDGDQLLGYWSDRGVLKPSLINYWREPDYIDSGGTRYFKVTNNSFNDYRSSHNKGGDFMVYSTVKIMPVSILIHLSETDFQEYKHRKKELGL